MKKPSENSNEIFPGDLPGPVLKHHLETLSTPMTEWRNRKRLPPVLLITGQSGIGKRGMAYFLAQWIACEKSGWSSQVGTAPCQKCDSCLQMRSGNDVNLIEVQSENESETGTPGSGALKIDQFRKLKETMGFGSMGGQYKRIIIPSADRMTPQAANSVLKILEDTPPGWAFLLTANDPTLLLPTITSRCQILRLKPLSSEVLYSVLESSGSPLNSEQKKICVELAQGSWARAHLFSQDEIWEKRDLIFHFLVEPTGAVQSLMDWASQDDQSFELIIDLLEQSTTDLLRWSTSTFVQSPDNFPWRQIDGKKDYVRHLEKVIRNLGSLEAARSFWLERAERLARVRQEAESPMNRKLLIQDLLLPWIGAMSL